MPRLVIETHAPQTFYKIKKLCEAAGTEAKEETRCRDCKWLGRESVVAGEYRCNRTDRITTLEDFCSKAVRRDA